MPTASKRYERLKQVMDHYETSGLTQEEYCKKNTVDFKQFRYYRYRLNLVQ